ncbi:hypothetical protein CC80DRAFT_381394, partial [Byssothecium circinans]
MCRRAVCESCEKTTWWGCGNHIPSVMDGVPHDQWCTCTPKVQKAGHEYPPKGTTSS